MRESKAIHVTKSNIKTNLNKEYEIFANRVIRDRQYSSVSPRYGQKTQEVACQYDCKRDNLICTCKKLSTLRKRQDFRYFGLPKQIYTYHGSRSYTDIGVGSVKALQRKKVKKIYLPETDDRGVGSSDLSSFYLRRPRYYRAVNSYYENKRTSSKCVGGILEYNIGCVMNEKLSPIVQTISGSTSPKKAIPNKNIEIGSNTVVKSLTHTTTQVEDKLSNNEIENKPEVKLEEIIQPILVIKEDPKEMKTKTDSHKTAEKIEKPVKTQSSSDSLVQHVHNLEDPEPSDDKVSHASADADEPMENKLEREYRRIFAAKSKSRDSKTVSDRPMSDFKSTSTLKRRFEALRRGLAKKEDSKKNSLITNKPSSQVSAPSRKDVSINSDPPSLEGRSFSNTKTYSPFRPVYSQDRALYKPKTTHYIPSVSGRKERDSSQWSSRPDDEDSECQGVKGMFKIWGKKFNLEDDNYKRRCTPRPSRHSSRKNDAQIPEESRVQIKAEAEPKKEGRKFFFFKKKNKEHKEKPYKPKKGVTAGRCEVKDGLMIKIGGGAKNYVSETFISEPEIMAEDYEDMARKAWLKKFLTQSNESKNSVQVRWNNKAYGPSSSTVFELMDTMYQDTGVVFRSKSQVTVQSSYKSYTEQHVNFMHQNIEAWMIPKTITDRPKPLPLKIKCKSNEDRKNNIEVRISDQKWFIDKSKAFSHKIEVFLHSRNFKKLNRDESSEYLRIDIPKGFFVDSSSDDINKNQSSEEVYKIVEYETGSDLKKEITPRIYDTGDSKQNNIMVSVSVNECKDRGILEIGKPAVYRDVVIQGSHVHIPKRCDVIGVGIITQGDLRDLRKPILKFQDEYSDDESEHNTLRANEKKCELAESYLREYYRHWTRLGIDLYSWCVSDSHLRCCSENSRASFNNQGDGTKSCPNIFDDFQASTIVSSCDTSSCSQCHTHDDKDNTPPKCSWFGKFKKKPKETGKNGPCTRIQPKDSIEVFKRRKIYAASMKSKWATSCPDFDQPHSVPSVESKSCTPGTLIECPKLMKSCCKPIEPKPRRRSYKKHVSLPDCDTMNELLAKQLADSVPEGILAFKGGGGCEACKKKGSCPKHAKIIPNPSCEIPRPACWDSCEQMKNPPCSESKQSCEPPPERPAATQSGPPSPGPPCRKSPSCPATSTSCMKPSCPATTNCPPSPPPCKKKKSPPQCPASPRPCKKPPSCPASPPPRKKAPSCPPTPPPSCKSKPPCPSPPRSPSPCKSPKKQGTPCPTPPCTKPPSSPRTSQCKKPASSPSPPLSPEKSPCCPPSPPLCIKPPSPCPSTPPSKKSPPPSPPCPPSPPPCDDPPPCPSSPPKKKPPSCPPSPPPCPPPPPPCPPSPPPCQKQPSCPPSPPPCSTPPPPSPPSPPPPCPPSPPPCPPSPPPCQQPPPPPPAPPPSQRPPSGPPPPPPCKCPPSGPPSPPPCQRPPSGPPPPPPCQCPPSGPPSPPPCQQPPSGPPSPPPCQRRPSGPPSPPPCQRPPSGPPSPPPCQRRPSGPPSQPSCQRPPSEPPSPPPCQRPSSGSPSPPPCQRPPSGPPSPPPCQRPPSGPPSPPPCQRPPSGPPSPPPCRRPPSGPPSPPPCQRCSPPSALSIKKPSCPPTLPPCRKPRSAAPPPCPHMSPPNPPSPPCCPPSPPSYPASPPRCPHSQRRPPPPPPGPVPQPCCYPSPCIPRPPASCSPICSPPPPPCHRNYKQCPLSPPSCPASPPKCCSRDITQSPSSPPPCKRAPSNVCKKFSSTSKKKAQICPASPPCMPKPCKPTYCKQLGCQHSPRETVAAAHQSSYQNYSTTSCSYNSLQITPDAPFLYSPIHPCPQEQPKKNAQSCNSSPCGTHHSSYKPDSAKIGNSYVIPKLGPCDECKPVTDEFPWPTNNQISNQPSETSYSETNAGNLPINYGNCIKDCPMMSKLSCETVASTKKECKSSCPNKQGSPLPPYIQGMQCPPPKLPSPPAEPTQQRPPEAHKSKPKVSGLFLKMEPSKKKTCSKDCLAWDTTAHHEDGCISLNSEEKITIRLRKETPSTQEIRDDLNIKVQDEDGMTLFERKDYRLQRAGCDLQRPSVLGEMYKTSEIRRVTADNSAQAIGTDKDFRKEITEVESDASIANLIEIQFKLKVTQGDKTTEINITNDSEKEQEQTEKIGQTNKPLSTVPQEVFIVKDGGERLADHSDQKNDINIRIVIKNFKPKTKKKKSISLQPDNYSKDFSKKISAKFHTVSTGYSDVLRDDNVFSVHRATVDLTSSVDKSKTHSNRSDEIMSEPLVEIERGILMGSSDTSVCRCITTDISEGKSEETEMKSVPSQKYSHTRDNLEETDTEKLTDHKYEYTEETDTEKQIKYDTEETDTDRQMEPPKYDTEETDTEKQPEKKYDTFMSTDTDETDAVLEIKTSKLIEVIVKPHTKDEKKEMLKHVFEKAHETKTKNKNRMRKLRDMLKVILTSDSSDHDDTKLPITTKELSKDVTYASLKPNYFRDTDSMNNYYTVESNPAITEGEINRQVVYPSIENNSECSNSIHSDMLSSETESPKHGGCMCSTLATRLKLASRMKSEGGCCCCTKTCNKKHEETTCDMNELSNDNSRQSEYILYDFKTEYVDGETQNSTYLINKMNSTNFSFQRSLKTSSAGSFNLQRSIKTDSGVINVDSRHFTVRSSFTPDMNHVRECEMRKLNRNTILSISDEDKIVLLSGNSARLVTNKKSEDVVEENMQNPSAMMRASDILQSYETKKAVLEIYTEKTMSDEGEHLVAKLPKFVYDRENEIQTNYEAMATNTYKAVCKKNIIMMTINR